MIGEWMKALRPHRHTHSNATNQKLTLASKLHPSQLLSSLAPEPLELSEVAGELRAPPRTQRSLSMGIEVNCGEGGRGVRVGETRVVDKGTRTARPVFFFPTRKPTPTSPHPPAYRSSPPSRSSSPPCTG